MEVKQTINEDGGMVQINEKIFDPSLPGVDRCHLGVIEDDSFVSELDCISKSLKSLIGKTGEMRELMKAVFGDSSKKDKVLVQDCKTYEDSEEVQHDMIAELRRILSQDKNCSLSNQSTSDVLSETVNYINLLQAECDQSKACKEKIKSLCMQYVTLAIRLKRLKTITKLEEVHRIPQIN